MVMDLSTDVAGSAAHPTPAVPAQRRRAERRSAPELRVLITGRPYSTLNWSVSGMLLRNYGVSQKVGDRLDLIAATERSRQHARITGRIVRVDTRNRLVAVTLDAVPDGSLKVLSGFAAR